MLLLRKLIAFVSTSPSHGGKRSISSRVSRRSTAASSKATEHSCMDLNLVVYDHTMTERKKPLSYSYMLHMIMTSPPATHKLLRRLAKLSPKLATKFRFCFMVAIFLETQGRQARKAHAEEIVRMFVPGETQKLTSKHVLECIPPQVQNRLRNHEFEDLAILKDFLLFELVIVEGVQAAISKTYQEYPL